MESIIVVIIIALGLCAGLALIPVSMRAASRVPLDIATSKPHNLEAFIVEDNLSAVKEKVSKFARSNGYKIEQNSDTFVVLSTGSGVPIPFGYKYFYPIYLSQDQSGRTHVDAGTRNADPAIYGWHLKNRHSEFVNSLKVALN